MSADPLPPPHARACWCGDARQFAYSDEFNVCRTCGTLISRAPVPPEALRVRTDTDELYAKDYWLERQQAKYGFPSIRERARLDLPERCVHWLRLLLRHKLPGPGMRTLEIGCAHGGYVALMAWAGYEAHGTEMSPWVVDYARATFGVPVTAGRIEDQSAWPPASFDAIILNDVLEHLPDPLATLTRAAGLLKPDGIFIIQTPEYKEHLAYADLAKADDLFLRHMAGKNDEHLYLYSRRATGTLWSRLGFESVAFHEPIFAYDQFYVAARGTPAEHDEDAVAAALAVRPSGRLVLALLDKARESNDRWWAMQRLQAELKNRQPKP